MSVPLKHKAEAPLHLSFALLTVSTSKAREAEAGGNPTDESGDLAEKLLLEAGHRIADRRLIPDDRERLKKIVGEWLNSKEIDVIVTMGGTGITASDVTIEALEGFLEKQLPGFGELFRFLSFQEIGSPAMMTRTLAGVVRGKALFCLPGSPNAVRLALEKLILPEAGHVVKHAREP